MKELTKEDKARRYDEVINRMKRYVVDECGCSRIKVADVFPELIETDDEKIRKWIIDDIRYNMNNEPLINSEYKKEAEKAIAWLENQGERKTTDKIQIGKEYKCIASPRYSTFMTGKIYKPEDKFLCGFMNFCSDCFEPIEDSEQIDLASNTDKVDSKFKVGDWVVTSYGEVSQVISVDKDCDGYTLDNGNYFSGSWCENYHLWTIDDAKDSDVLVDCNKDEDILMFRRIGNTEWDDVIDYHCYYSCLRKAFCVQKGVEYWGTTNDHKLKPATKEQRDLLFSKMKKAGYKWDSEHKQLIMLNHFEDNDDMVEPKFKVGDIVQYITDSTDRRKIEEVDTLCNMYHTDSSPIMFEIEDEWKVVVNAEDVEQNPTDKVEPKFKVGDWITNGQLHCKISEVLDDRYIVDTKFAKRSAITFERVHNYHLWTIADAKDGDVLTWDDNKCIALFKNIYDEESFNSHGFVGHCTNIFESRISYHDIEGAHPATKEQRDLLFQKMKDEGYSWDDEKKELKELKKT